MATGELKLLLVEDNPVDARLLPALLARHGMGQYTCVHCGTLEQALARAALEKFDVVALDLTLPDSEGLASLAAIAEAFPELPIVVLTGNEGSETALAALRDGAQDYLVKSRFDGPLLDRTLRYAVGRATAQRERKVMERQLQQALKLESLGQLAAGIAHEINTPIQFIANNTSFVRDALEDLFAAMTAANEVVERASGIPEVAGVADSARKASERADLAFLRAEMPKALEQALDGVHRVANIVRAMKQFAHPGGNERRLLQLNEAIETAITISRNEWKYVAEVSCDFAEALPAIWCLPGEVNQVLLNLIVNAAHAIEARAKAGGPERGTIRIATRTSGSSVELLVADSGCGIPDSIRHKVFDPFFTTKAPGKGTGQGLAITHNVVVKQHGGEIDFSSEVGVGTTFRVRLPVGAPGEGAAAVSAGARDGAMTRA